MIIKPSNQVNKLEKIYNYYKVPNLFETSGQPNKQQLKLLAKKGYKVIINLAAKSFFDGVIINEAEILNVLNIKYIHIPVKFNNPTDLDFQKFVSYVQKYKNKKLWVHCIANMRVSAFTYRYRKDILKLKHDNIIGDMKAIWIPNKTWNTFLNID